ncbi:MAG: glycosyltransferase [Candidatus Scalindua sp.]|nr:glycosyltransferase [Candidatus Scalindua sp.]
MKTKTTVCHLVYSFDGIGGLENGLINIVNNLDREKFQHIICSLTKVGSIKERIQKNNEVKFYELNKRNGNDIKVFFKLFKIFRKEKIDILHLRNWATMLEGFLPAKIAGLDKIIYSEHGRHFEDIDDNKKLNTLIKKYIFNRVDHLLLLSDKLKNEMIQVYKIKRKIDVIFNGVDVEKFVPSDNSSIRKIHGWSDDQMIVGAVARLDKGKNIDQLVKGTISKDSGYKLVIIGDGPEMYNLKSIINDMDAKGRVVLMGNRDDVHLVLKCFDVFVLPSLSEGISNVILEAMACGLPIIAYDVGGNGELVVNREGGYLVRLGDSEMFLNHIDKILEDDSLRKKMGIFNRKLVEERFSIHNMIDSYSRLYSL